ncbi:MAG: TPM domain-containing protein [Desulfobacteraceae bacterium]
MFPVKLAYKKHFSSCLFCSLLFFLLWATFCPVHAERPIPEPQGLVNDFAGVIPDASAQKITAVSAALLQKTGVPIVVVTMPDIGGAEYNDYANRLYTAWGIGKKGEDKGVLIFITIQERKMRIETGYGVEGILPDGRVGEIRDRYMLPYLKEDRFAEGLLAGTLAVAKIIADDSGVELTQEPQAPPPKEKGSLLSFLPILFIIMIFVMMSKRRGGSWLLFLPLLFGLGGGGSRYSSGGMGGSFGGFGGGFGGFGGGMSGGGGAGGGF